jgi:hypothetical protein
VSMIEDNHRRDYIKGQINRLLDQFVGCYVSASEHDVTRDRIHKTIIEWLTRQRFFFEDRALNDVRSNPDVDVAVDNDPTHIEAGEILVKFVPHTERGRRFLDKLHNPEFIVGRHS